ncbi:MAG: hypothetical protein IPK88_08370 [Saprospiraceae bacterium]|nr:hypothetical protein [Candidatus Defluviibacterium haderslevense]
MKKISIFIFSMKDKLRTQLWNARKNSIRSISSVFITIFLILFCTQCKKESNEIFSSKQQLTSRINTSCWNITQSDSAIAGTFQPGTYTISNSCIRFTNQDEFNKTELFLNHATASEVESWYNSLSILTSEKAYLDFMDQYNCNDSITIYEINGLLSAFGNTIRYNWINQEEISISPKFITYSAFRNMDGNFMIGDQIEAESDGVRITIFDGNWSKLAQIRNTPGFPSDTVSYEGDTAFIIDPILTSRISCEYECCPNNISSTDYYGPSNRRRLKVELVWTNVTSYRLLNNPRRYYATPKINLRLNKLELDKKDDFGFWSCFKQHFKFNLRCDWYIGATNTSKLEHSNENLIVKDNAWTCKVNGDLKTFASSEIGPFEVNPEVFICPYRINFTTSIFDIIDQPPVASFSTGCLKDNNPCICYICPSGYNFDSRNCFSTVCAKSPFIWNNGFYYKSYPNGPNGGVCPYGGTFDGLNCYIGPVPSGYEGKSFVYNNCYYVVPKCP